MLNIDKCRALEEKKMKKRRAKKDNNTYRRANASTTAAMIFPMWEKQTIVAAPFSTLPLQQNRIEQNIRRKREQKGTKRWTNIQKMNQLTQKERAFKDELTFKK